MSIPIDDVMRALARHPGGVTTHALAAELGMKENSLRTRLGKVWMYGGPVDRDFGVRVNGAHAQTVWRPR